MKNNRLLILKGLSKWKNTHSDSLATQKENKVTTIYNNNNDNDNDEESNIETDVDDDTIYCKNDNSTNKKTIF